MKNQESWGRYPKVTTRGRDFWWPDDVSFSGTEKHLAVGLGRSYGDVGLLAAEHGSLLGMRHCGRLLGFDEKSGILSAETGCSLESVLSWSVPRGWFLPVVPGTRHVTLGGAVANDIHGKNHHRDGTFGCWVEGFSLFRSAEGWLEVEKGDALFAATVGGLGLTGVLGEIRLRLQKIPPGGWIEQETRKFGDLAEGCAHLQEMDAEFPMSVAWLDLGSGKSGQGVAMGGRFAAAPEGKKEVALKPAKLGVPLSAPHFLLNGLSIGAFNRLYGATGRSGRCVVDFPAYFFPLDGLSCWNRLYGKRGFLQYQCVLAEEAALAELVEVIRASGQRPFLTVLKKFGAVESPGWLSFPRPGWTLAMDFPMNGEGTLDLMTRMDAVVRAAGGRLYPAKDARMAADFFKESYPDWTRLEEKRDPAMMSEFWHRMTR